MRRFSWKMVLIGAALVASASSSGAQLTLAQAHSEDQLTAGTLKLSLADAVALGLEYNLDVEVERHTPLIAYEGSEIAWGAYDPAINGEAGYAYNRDPNSFSLNAQSTNKQQIQEGRVGVAGVIPYLNMDLALEYDGQRRETNSLVQTLRPEYNSGLALTARIPLLRDLIWSQAWTEVKTSSVRYTASNEQFRASLMNVVQSIENAYWNLVATNDQARVAQKSLDTATALLKQTRTEYEVGVKSKVEVYEAEAGMAEREFELIRAENFADTAQDRLIAAILGTKLTAGSLLQLDPIDSPDNVIEYQIDPEAAAKQAFRLRPELAVARYAVEERELQLKFAKNQRLPRFDVLGNVGTGGKDGVGVNSIFGGNGPPGSPNGMTGDFGDANSQFFTTAGGADMGVRAQITIPIGNIRGRHTVSQSKLELRRTNTQLTRLEQSIILEIRDAVRNLSSARRGITAAERRRIAASEQLRAEQIRLEHGESTPFDVLQRERDLVDAESQKINALQLYQTSLTSLHRAQGTILDVRAINVSDVEPLR